MRNTLKADLVTAFGILTGLAGLVGFKITLVGALGSEGKLAVFFIGLFAFYYFVAHLTTRAMWRRESRYGSILTDLNVGFAKIHHLARLSNVDREYVVQAFEVLCDKMARVFEEITGKRCSVCIKILKLSRQEIAFETLCRDQNVLDIRKRVDEKSKEQNIVHKLENNTDYTEAHHGMENYFFSNFLPFLEGYANTSFELFPDPYRYRSFNPITRIWRWPLPYKSTIVVPIQPRPGFDEELDLMGFLCVDSKKMFVFRKKYDVDLMKGVADGIYNTLKLFVDIV